MTMVIFFGIMLIVFSLFLSWFIYEIQKDSDEAILSAILGASIISVLIAGICIINEQISPSITPIDVYRGNTTLEITYRDTTALDSVVVWKEEVR
jgi:hypothetical protein